MVDELAFWRPSSSELQEDLTETHVPGAKVWEGKCLLTPTEGPREQPVGEGIISMRDADAIIPIDAPTPRIDDEVEITASRDPELVGRWFRVTDVRVYSNQPARRLSMVQAQPSRNWGSS